MKSPFGNIIANGPASKRVLNRCTHGQMPKAALPTSNFILFLPLAILTPPGRSTGVPIKDIAIAAGLGFAAFVIITLVFGWSS